MKPLLCFLLTLLLPILGRSEDVSLSAAPDWQSMSDAQKDSVFKAYEGSNVRLIDGSIHTGGGSATFLLMPLAVTSKFVADGEVGGYIKGATKNGTKLLDRQDETLAGLPGVSLSFQGKANGDDLFFLAYQFFTTEGIYNVSFYNAQPLSRTDPMVTSYLARLKFDPSVKPANLHTSALLAIITRLFNSTSDSTISSGTTSSGMGYWVGQLLGIVIVIFVIAKVVFAILGRSQKRKPEPPPLPR